MAYTAEFDRRVRRYFRGVFRNVGNPTLREELVDQAAILAWRMGGDELPLASLGYRCRKRVFDKARRFGLRVRRDDALAHVDGWVPVRRADPRLRRPDAEAAEREERGRIEGACRSGFERECVAGAMAGKLAGQTARELGTTWQPVRKALNRVRRRVERGTWSRY